MDNVQQCPTILITSSQIERKNSHRFLLLIIHIELKDVTLLLIDVVGLNTK